MDKLWKYLHLLTVIFISVCCPLDVQAVELSSFSSDLNWHNLDVDGHRAAVFCIHTDKQGLVWAGTSQGLFLFDGAETHSILPGVQVFAIAEQAESLYLGTNRGLVRYCSTDGSVENLSTEKPVDIRCMTVSGCKLLLGCLDGLFSYDIDSKKFENIGQGLPHRSVYSLLIDSRGCLYAGTYNGLARYDVEKSCFYTVESPVLNRNNQSKFINSLLELPDQQTIYIGTGDGLYTYESGTEKWGSVEEVEKKGIKSLATDNAGNLLVGTHDGLYYMKPQESVLYKRDTREVGTPSGNQIWSVMTDDSGIIWIGHERGLSYASNSSYFKSVKISSIIHSGESNEFICIFRDSRGTLWLGGTNGILMLKSKDNVRWHHLGSVDGRQGDLCVRSVMEDSHGTIWLSTDGGIYRYDSKHDSFISFILTDPQEVRSSNWVYAIRQTGEDLWVGSFLGGVNRVALSKLSGNGGNVKSDFSFERGSFLANDNISNLVVDREERLWILLYGDNHLYCYDSRTGQQLSYDIFEIAGQSPSHICIDNNDRLWCAFKGGVLIYSQNAAPSIIRFPLSGSDESVLTMAAVDNGVWVSTMSNLWSLNGEDSIPNLIPVPQKGLTALWDDRQTGKVLAGWVDEVVEINKVPFDTASHLGKVRIVLDCSGGRVKNMQNLINRPEGLSIPYGGSVSLMVSSLFYTPDVIPHMEYRVVRQRSNVSNEDWVIMPEHSSMINLTGLGFGEYEIQIKEVGSPLSPAVIRLHVDKPYWLSWWAILIYLGIFSVIAGCIFWYLRHRAIRLAHEKERNEALANIRQKLDFLSNENHDLESRIEQLLKTREEMTAQMRLHAITDAKPVEAESPVEKQLSEIAQIVEENISNLELNGAFIGEKCNMSEKQLYRLLKKNLNVTPSEYIRNVRIQKAAMLLEQKYFTVSEVAYMVGFSAPSYFSKCFQDYFGVAPSSYRAEDAASSN